MKGKDVADIVDQHIFQGISTNYLAKPQIRRALLRIK